MNEGILAVLVFVMFFVVLLLAIRILKGKEGLRQFFICFFMRM